MECDKVRAEYPDLPIEPCCDSCHDEVDEGLGEDLWFPVHGVTRHICCAVACAFEGDLPGNNADGIGFGQW